MDAEKSEIDTEQKTRRSSILKPQKRRNPFSELDHTEMTSDNLVKAARRVSFASSNFVKPFAADPEQNTIWDNTYEEEVDHTDSTKSSYDQIQEPKLSAKLDDTLIDVTFFYPPEYECSHESSPTKVFAEGVDKENVKPELQDEVGLTKLKSKVNIPLDKENVNPIINDISLVNPMENASQKSSRVEFNGNEYTVLSQCDMELTKSLSASIKENVVEESNFTDIKNKTVYFTECEMTFTKLLANELEDGPNFFNSEHRNECNIDDSKKNNYFNISETEMEFTSTLPVNILEDRRMSSRRGAIYVDLYDGDMELTNALPVQSFVIETDNELQENISTISKSYKSTQSTILPLENGVVMRRNECDDKELTTPSFKKDKKQIDDKYVREKTISFNQTEDMQFTGVIGAVHFNQSTLTNNVDQLNSSMELTTFEISHCGLNVASSSLVKNNALKEIEVNAAVLEQKANLTSTTSKEQRANLQTSPLSTTNVASSSLVKNNALKEFELNAVFLEQKTNLTSTTSKKQRANLETSPLSNTNVANSSLVKNNALKEFELNAAVLEQKTNLTSTTSKEQRANLQTSPLSNTNVASSLLVKNNALKEIEVNSAVLEQKTNLTSTTSNKRRANLETSLLSNTNVASSSLVINNDLKEIEVNAAVLEQKTHLTSTTSKEERANLQTSPLSNTNVTSSSLVMNNALKEIEVNAIVLEQKTNLTSTTSKEQRANLQISPLSNSNILYSEPMKIKLRTNELPAILDLPTSLNLQSLNGSLNSKLLPASTPHTSFHMSLADMSPYAEDTQQLIHATFSKPAINILGTNNDILSKPTDESLGKGKYKDVSKIEEKINYTSQRDIINRTYLKENIQLELGNPEKELAKVIKMDPALQDTNRAGNDNPGRVSSEYPLSGPDDLTMEKGCYIDDAIPIDLVPNELDLSDNGTISVSEEGHIPEQSESPENISICSSNYNNYTLRSDLMVKNFKKYLKLEFYEVESCDDTRLTALVRQCEENCALIKDAVNRLSFQISKVHIIDLKEKYWQDMEEISNSVSGATECSEEEAKMPSMASFEAPKSLSERISEISERCGKYWKFHKKEDDYYCFSTLFGTLPFKVHVHPDLGLVYSVETYTNLEAVAKPICWYDLKFFRHKLKKENLLAVLGAKFDILTLLDYVYMTMEEVVNFHTEYNRLTEKYLSSHHFKMNKDFSVTFEILNVDLIIWWIISVNMSPTSPICKDDVKAISKIEAVDEECIKSIAENTPKGPIFLSNFIEGVEEYVKRIKKKIEFRRGNKMLVHY